jgi:hypothetical protein
MKRSSLAMAALACITFASASTLSIGTSGEGTLSIGVTDAQARVGRPLTPVSVAGVARRTTRRAVVGGAVVGGAVVARPRCGYYPYPPCY